MSIFKNIGKGLLDLATYAFAPSYPENPTEEELLEYYDKLVNRGEPFASLLYDPTGSHALDALTKPEAIQDFGALFGNADLFFHYVKGEGKPISLFEDKKVTDSYLKEIHSIYGNNMEEWEWQEEDSYLWKRFDPEYREMLNETTEGDFDKYAFNVWYDSRNPDYPAEEGWQFLRYEPREHLDRYGDLKSNEAYNLLGQESIVRRRFDYNTNEFEYEIVEGWDLIQGQGSWEKAYDKILDYGEKVGVRGYDEGAFYNTGLEQSEVDPYHKIKDFDKNNFSPSEFNMILNDYMHNYAGFGSQLLEDEMPFLGSSRIVGPYLAEKAYELAPNFIDWGDSSGEVLFKPDYYGFQYMIENAAPFNIEGTTKFDDPGFLFGEKYNVEENDQFGLRNY